MINDIFQNINSFTLNNVEEKLKEPLSSVIRILKNCNIYKAEKLQKFEEDLIDNKICFKVEPVNVSIDNVGNDMDRVSYGYGYVDFGKESIVFTGKLKKKIVIWSEIVKDFDEQTIVKALLFLLDLYFAVDEVAVYSNYTKMQDGFKRNINFEYMLPIDIYKNVPIGGFRLSILDKWCRFFAVAIADIISSRITGTSLFFKRRANFLKTMIKIHNQTLDNFIINQQLNN